MTMSTLAGAQPLQSFRLIARDIKLAHSVFALPFALLAAFMAAKPQASPAIVWTRFAGQLALVIAAMVLARTCAMLANRLLDRHIDKHNPRTAGRALPSGKLSAGAAIVAWSICAALFLSVCAWFGTFYDNWWPLILGLPVLLWICAYGILKRFTSLCHVYLGASLAISPIAAAIAIHPESVLNQPAIWLLSAMVLCWVAGFDIIYALQDVDVDRDQRLFSIPSRFGVRNAMLIARGLHILASACLVACLVIDPRFNAVFAVGIVVVMALLLYEHLTVARWGTTKIALAFFTLNGVVSCVLGALGIVDVLV